MTLLLVGCVAYVLRPLFAGFARGFRSERQARR